MRLLLNRDEWKAAREWLKSQGRPFESDHDVVTGFYIYYPGGLTKFLRKLREEEQIEREMQEREMQERVGA